MGGAVRKAGAAGAGRERRERRSGGPNPPDIAFCKTALDAAACSYTGFRTAYTSPASIPRSATSNGSVRLVGPADWTSGLRRRQPLVHLRHTQDAAFVAPRGSYRRSGGGTDHHEPSRPRLSVHEQLRQWLPAHEECSLSSGSTEGSRFAQPRYNSTVGFLNRGTSAAGPSPSSWTT